MEFINVGYGNIVSSTRIVAVVSPDSAPIKRIIQEARDRSMLIDATWGRKTRAVIFMDSDHVVLSAVQPETISARSGSHISPAHAEEDDEIPQMQEVSR